jgi:hypothetical protein|tara:strand:+ start:969 stop:1181 length:213 start_codon:yes stop_codon:yes gene_type:complete
MGAWLCTGIRACPPSWEPFALVLSIIFFVITLICVFAAVIGARLYKIFDTALVVDDSTKPVPESNDAGSD